MDTRPDSQLTTRHPPRRILEDASGRRLRRLRFLGRVVALLAFCWLAIVLLGGLGVGPAKHVPFGTALRAGQAPPPLRTLPEPVQPSPADLAPAAPAPPPTVTTAVARKRTAPAPAATPKPAARKPVRARGRATAPGQLKKPVTTTSATVTRGRSASAPGRVKKTTTTVTTTPAAHGRAKKKR